MRYRVRLFASVREKIGSAQWDYQSDRALKGSELLDVFFAANPSVSGLRAVTRLAVNQSFCETDPLLAENDELALIPPVSGG